MLNSHVKFVNFTERWYNLLFAECRDRFRCMARRRTSLLTVWKYHCLKLLNPFKWSKWSFWICWTLKRLKVRFKTAWQTCVMKGGISSWRGASGPSTRCPGRHLVPCRCLPWHLVLLPGGGNLEGGIWSCYTTITQLYVCTSHTVFRSEILYHINPPMKVCRRVMIIRKLRLVLETWHNDI